MKTRLRQASALDSLTLLKNDVFDGSDKARMLPLDPSQKIVMVGPVGL